MKEQPKNSEIAGIQIRLIGDKGEQLGIVTAEEGNRLATLAGMDLVMISPNAAPPVCKIMDYSKHKFEQAKKLKEQRKNQKIVKLKEVSLSVTIDTHDLMTKAKSAMKFLSAGDKVKVNIRMMGRQQARPQQGIEVMREFAKIVEETASIDKDPVVQGRNITMFLVPKKI